MDAVTKLTKKCTSLAGIFLGGLIGLLLGTVWFCMFYLTDNKKILFFNELVSNNVVCNRPEKQKFKCAVYKNGKLLKTL